MTSTALNPQTAESPIIDLIDDHDEILEKWKSFNLQNRVLIHFDEHSDFNWIGSKDPKALLQSRNIQDIQQKLSDRKGWIQESIIHREGHLGNFLHEIFHQKMVSEWYWVYPTPLWNQPHERSFVWKQLKALHLTRPQEMSKPKKVGETFQAKIMGVKAIVTSLDHLPSFNEKVLVSLDVDYLTANPVSRPQSLELERKRLPWIWPNELYDQLREKKINASHFAIAHSVQGGYTPIRYKFFGESLKQLFMNQGEPADYKKLKKAYILRSTNNELNALRVLEAEIPNKNFKATFHYEKAQILYNQGKFHNAKESMDQARAADSEFSSKYNCYAPILERSGMLEEARLEYKRMRILTPDLIYPILGEAYYLAMFQSPWQGLQKYEEVLKQDVNNFAAHFFSGGIYRFQLKKPSLALESYQKAYGLRQDDPNLLICIGLCHMDLKQYTEAKHWFREALKFGAHNHLTYACLGRIYWRLSKHQKAWEMFQESVRLWIKQAVRKLRGFG